MMEDKNTDAVLLQAPVAFGANLLRRIFHCNDQEIKAFQDGQKRNLDMIRQRVAEYGKPVYVVMPVNDVETHSYLIQERMPAYASPRRAARTVHHLAWYKNYLDSNQR